MQVVLEIWQFIILIIFLISLGVVAGFMIANYIFQKRYQSYQKENSLQSKKQVEDLFKAFGMPASKEKINKVMTLMNKKEVKKKPKKIQKH